MAEAETQTPDIMEQENFATLLYGLKEEMAEMRKTQAAMMELLQQMSDNVNTEKDLRLKAEAELEKMKEKMTDADKTAPPLPPSAPPKPSLLLGTSLLRNVDPNSLDNWQVIAKGGAKINDLHKALNELPEDQSFAEIVIIGGSIDLESKSNEDIVTDYLATTVSASLRADKTTICSILPRTDKDLREKTRQVNDDLKKACDDGNVSFIDMDDTFLLRNGAINTANLVEDGLHLAKHGVDNLMKCCNVKVRKDLDSTYTNDRYKTDGPTSDRFKTDGPLYFQGHTHPLSNFYQLSNFSVHGVSFATSEAAYVYEKALHHDDYATAEAVRKSRTGIHAKRLGDKIRTNASWQRRKVDVMDTIIRAKLKVCDAARRVLLNSDDRPIIENTQHQFWGRGKANSGENMLGELWMLQRNKLRAPPRKPSTPQWATRNQQPRCYKCGEQGHLSEQCRQSGTLACWSCGTLGHKRKHCRELNTIRH
jgi:ribA/ribD-fused uncharacterized protein